MLKKKHKDTFVVFIEKAGYEAVEVQVTNEIAGAGAAGMAGNVVFGGLIGAAVDAGSGAMLKTGTQSACTFLIESNWYRLNQLYRTVQL